MPVMSPIVVETKNSATLPELMAKLADERVVYVGETHTAYEDHLLQLDVLREMATQPGELAVGVEWFQARFQPVVDAYMAGEIGEAEFLRRTEYYERWRFDYRLYRPLVEFAKEEGVPLIALNASRELTSEIGRVGIDDLPDNLREELPDDYDFSDRHYENSLRTMFEMHPTSDRKFEHFLQAQLTWDETMAQNVAGYLGGGDEKRMVVFAGKGHVAGRGGIPNRVTRRTGVQGATIVTFKPTARQFNTADYMILANEQVLPAAGIMRVLLDERDGGVFVKGFTPGSPAETAGVEEGDLILKINGVDVNNYVDLKLAMLDQRPGNEIELMIRRDTLLGGSRTENYRFDLVAAASRHL